MGTSIFAAPMLDLFTTKIVRVGLSLYTKARMRMLIGRIRVLIFVTPSVMFIVKYWGVVHKELGFNYWDSLKCFKLGYVRRKEKQAKLS